MSESVKVEIEIGKVEKEVLDCVISIAKSIIKDKASAAQVGIAHFPELLKIAGDASQLGGEVAAYSEVALASYAAIEIEKAFK